MLKTEWKDLLNNKGLIIVLIAIALIPAIYCFLYLSSMWNTYGKMADIPVALVNHDQKLDYQGKTINIGENLVKNLKSSNTLDYHVVSQSKARQGIKNGNYYMVVTIPKTFSKNATTLLTDHPQQLHLYYRLNSGRNFIVSKMTSGAANAIKSKIATQVTHMYTTILLSTLSKVSAGMQTAATGSNQIGTGLTSLKSGSDTLNTGTQNLYRGTLNLQNGISSYATAVQKSAANSPTSTGIQKINQELPQLTAGAAAIKTGTAKLTSGTSALVAGNNRLTTNLSTSATKLDKLATASKNANYLATPVVATTTDEAKVPNNGTGMAPFAIAIGLFVGGIALGTMFDAYTPKIKPQKAWAWWWSKFSIIMSISVLQGLILFLTLDYGNHLKPISQLALLIAILLGSTTFLSLIFCLRIILGGFGTWLITIILVLQLSASNGLYPVELTSGFASKISSYLPMTYLIDALRHAISLGGNIISDAAVLLLITIVLNIPIIMKFHHDIKNENFRTVKFD